MYSLVAIAYAVLFDLLLLFLISVSRDHKQEAEACCSTRNIYKISVFTFHSTFLAAAQSSEVNSRYYWLALLLLVE